ncbi:TPA: beta-ketoacyl synthase chain length factor [Enterobacter cancerogenus]|uniref:beta-ketoacyl synthase chain length factor n=1 Tax=Enterobacter sp. TaxID=42895 RepID=UPI0032F21E02|nr:beta-ketoacyl synthase chain length factor [Enterobacter cancerogenus]HDR2164819.1 beta-ketoacyl synthase chain length factor [Enterobacter cancerogenus]HDR2267832.1 beta-ketoacyl synthase chain length factor [Enterobacter cancerogenus]
MKFTLNIIDWQASAPGLSNADAWQAWSRQSLSIDPAAPLAKLTELPMMTARRLNSGSKLAVDIGLSMLRKHSIDAVVYCSRHGELERNYRILHALATEQPVSPTDFAMSVHNSAVGNLTITARQPIVSSSVSAGLDTFQQGLCEVLSLLHAGYTRILLVDFDGTLPAFYHAALPPQMPTWPFALGLVIEAGDALACETQRGSDGTEPALPQSLLFLQQYLRDAPQFTVPGERLLWRWTRQ